MELERQADILYSYEEDYDPQGSDAHDASEPRRAAWQWALLALLLFGTCSSYAYFDKSAIVSTETEPEPEIVKLDRRGTIKVRPDATARPQIGATSQLGIAKSPITVPQGSSEVVRPQRMVEMAPPISSVTRPASPVPPLAGAPTVTTPKAPLPKIEAELKTPKIKRLWEGFEWPEPGQGPRLPVAPPLAPIMVPSAIAPVIETPVIRLGEGSRATPIDAGEDVPEVVIEYLGTARDVPAETLPQPMGRTQPLRIEVTPIEAAPSVPVAPVTPAPAPVIVVPPTGEMHAEQPAPVAPIVVVPQQAAGPEVAQTPVLVLPQTETVPAATTVVQAPPPIAASPSPESPVLTVAGAAAQTPAAAAIVQPSITPPPIVPVAPPPYEPDFDFKGRFVVQVASFKSVVSACAVWEELRAKYPNLFGRAETIVRPASTPLGQNVYRLRVGAFANRKKATAWCEAYKAEGGECFVTKR